MNPPVPLYLLEGVGVFCRLVIGVIILSIAKQIMEVLKERITDTFQDIEVRVHYKFISAEGVRSPEADMFIELPNTIICVEFEYRQPHPDTNVLKYLRWIDSYGVEKRIVVAQIFGPEFKGRNYISRVRNAVYLSKRTRDQIDYYPLFCTTYTAEQFEAQEPLLMQQLQDFLFNLIYIYTTQG